MSDWWNHLLNEVVECLDVKQLVNQVLAASELEEGRGVEDLIVVLDLVPVHNLLLHVEVRVNVLSEEHLKLVIVHKVDANGLL